MTYFLKKDCESKTSMSEKKKSFGATTNGALSFMDIMTAKTAKDFALDLKNKNQ